MTDLRKAAERALEAIEGVLDKYGEPVNVMSISGGLYEVVQCRDAITALRAALAQPEPEPVRRVQKQFMDEEVFYTAPPQRKPLTDKDIKGIVDVGLQTWTLGESTYEFARAIEKAHGIE